jgi:hypothetical protein
MSHNRANRASANDDRAQAMTSAATATVARIRRRYREFLTDSRSLLDRPALADGSEQLVREFIDAFDNAVEALGECTYAYFTRQAARALATAHAAEYAAALADQHARRMARHGIYPYRTAPLDARGLDQVEEARESLELVADTVAGPGRRPVEQRVPGRREQVGNADTGGRGQFRCPAAMRRGPGPPTSPEKCIRPLGTHQFSTIKTCH